MGPFDVFFNLIHLFQVWATLGKSGILWASLDHFADEDEDEDEMDIEMKSRQ